MIQPREQKSSENLLTLKAISKDINSYFLLFVIDHLYCIAITGLWSGDLRTHHLMTDTLNSLKRVKTLMQSMIPYASRLSTVQEKLDCSAISGVVKNKCHNQM